MSNLDIIAELAAVFDRVESDIDGLANADNGLRELWPDEIILAMEELLALRIVMKRAVKLMPEHRPELVRLFTHQRASVEWESPPFPPLALLEETTDAVAAAVERVRRERLLNRDLDDACWMLRLRNTIAEG